MLTCGRQTKSYYKQVSPVYSSALCQIKALIHSYTEPVTPLEFTLLHGSQVFPVRLYFPSHTQPASSSHACIFLIICTSHCVVMAPWNLIKVLILLLNVRLDAWTPSLFIKMHWHIIKLSVYIL